MLFRFADGQRPQVEGRDRTIRGVAFAVAIKLLPGEFVQTVQVHHAAPDREIAPADDIGALQGKDQQHFSSPDADAVQGGESSDDFSVGERRQFSDIEFVLLHSFADAFDIKSFAHGHAALLDLLRFGAVDGRRRNFAARKLQPGPYGGGSLGGDLLADDAVDEGGKQIRVDGSLDGADTFDRETQFFVFLFQMGDFFLAVGESAHAIVPAPVAATAFFAAGIRWG